MKRLLGGVAVLLVAAVAYLTLWPVPVTPAAWTAPEDRGLVDPFGPDDRLAAATAIDLGRYTGPEDVTAGHDGRLYATTREGVVIQIDGYGTVREFADTGGRALGIETAADGSLVVANAMLGLQRITREGAVEILLDRFDGAPLAYPNDVAVAPDGTIYLSESSTKFAARDSGDTYEAAKLDLLEHGAHGRVLAWEPQSGAVSLVVGGLNYANGVAVSEDGRYLLIAETGSYRILRHWLDGPQAGSTAVVLDNLPAFPDNINNGRSGRFWVGLVAPRSMALDALSGRPFLRKVVQRLPAALRPKALPSSHVIAITGEGDVLMNLQDPAARFPSLTGVYETPDRLYLTTLFGNALPVLVKREL